MVDFNKIQLYRSILTVEIGTIFIILILIIRKYEIDTKIINFFSSVLLILRNTLTNLFRNNRNNRNQENHVLNNINPDNERRNNNNNNNILPVFPQ